MSQYQADREVCHCHGVNSLPSISGGQESCWGPVGSSFPVPTGPWHEAVGLAEPLLLVTPQPGFPSRAALDLHTISPVLSLLVKTLQARFPSHLHGNAFAVTGVRGTSHQTQCAAAGSRWQAAHLERGCSLNHLRTDCPPKLSQISPATVCRGGGTVQHAAAQNTCPKRPWWYAPARGQQEWEQLGSVIGVWWFSWTATEGSVLHRACGDGISWSQNSWNSPSVFPENKNWSPAFWPNFSSDRFYMFYLETQTWHPLYPQITM